VAPDAAQNPAADRNSRLPAKAGECVGKANPGSRHGLALTRVGQVATWPESASLDIFWLRDESLSDSDNLPAPEVIAAEIVEDLEAALEQFREILADMGPGADSSLGVLACQAHRC